MLSTQWRVNIIHTLTVMSRRFQFRKATSHNNSISLLVSIYMDSNKSPWLVLSTFLLTRICHWSRSMLSLDRFLSRNIWMVMKWFPTSMWKTLIRIEHSTLTRMASRCRRECKTKDHRSSRTPQRQWLTTITQSTQPFQSRMPILREEWPSWTTEPKVALLSPQEQLNSCRTARAHLMTTRVSVSHSRRRMSMEMAFKLNPLITYKSAMARKDYHYRELPSIKLMT